MRGMKAHKKFQGKAEALALFAHSWRRCRTCFSRAESAGWRRPTTESAAAGRGWL